MRLICLLFGHRYKLKRHVTKNIKELYCKRCKDEFALNHATKSLLPLDDELKELHKTIKTKNK